MKKRLGLIAGMAFLMASAIPDLGEGIPDGFSFQTINFPGDTFTQLLGVNNSTSIAGYHGASINEGFQVTPPDSFSLESVPLSTSTQVIGINNSGMTDGFFVNGSTGLTEGFVFNNGQYASFDDPLGIGMTTINGVNDLGQIVEFDGPGGNIGNGFLGSPAPETGTLFLLGTGLLGVGVLVRRKTQGKSERL